MATMKAAQAFKQFHFEWRRDLDNYRVWRSDWLCDKFEVINAWEFKDLHYFCKLFSISIKEVED